MSNETPSIRVTPLEIVYLEEALTLLERLRTEDDECVPFLTHLDSLLYKMRRAQEGVSPQTGDDLDRDDLLQCLHMAREKGFVELGCQMHDSPPLTEEQDEDIMEGYDPCIPVVWVLEEES